MQQVAVIGVGRTPVAEHWSLSIRDLALQAVQSALQSAQFGPNDIDVLVVGNALSGQTSQQTHLGPLLADYVGLRGIEAYTVEGADAAGGLALRQGILQILSGMAQTVLVLGVEKMTDVIGNKRNSILATSLDADYEAAHGATPTALAGLLMRRYMNVYGVELGQFEGFSITAHANGNKNPQAMYRNLIKPGRFAVAPMVAEPVSLFDSAPEGDGACALILTSPQRAADLVPTPILITGSAVATDTVALTQREDMLLLQAVNIAAGRAYEQAGLGPQNIQVLELHDSYTILSTLQLEAAGFAKRGQGWTLAAEGKIGRDGPLPISTFGGLKARGHALGATGVYQAAEVVLQLQGQAGDNQIPRAHIGMTINLGGLGSTAVVHVFENRG
jgi:acetyl-CoA C-acetyltransferase